MEIEEHYNHLLGIQSPWQISGVDLNIQEQRADIDIEYADDVGLCPESGAISPNMVTRAGPLATINCEPRQAWKGAQRQQ